jgi:hypothetical protein
MSVQSAHSGGIGPPISMALPPNFSPDAGTCRLSPVGTLAAKEAAGRDDSGHCQGAACHGTRGR